MSLTSYLAAPPRASYFVSDHFRVKQEYCKHVFIKFGSDLLSHALRRSTIGATVLNHRVRNGIGCFTRAMTTKPNENTYQVKLYSAFTRSNQADWKISTGLLNALLHLHFRPIAWWSTTFLKGNLILRLASRLDAFSGYPFRT